MEESQHTQVVRLQSSKGLITLLTVWEGNYGVESSAWLGEDSAEFCNADVQEWIWLLHYIIAEGESQFGPDAGTKYSMKRTTEGWTWMQLEEDEVCLEEFTATVISSEIK